jgi:Flp pilus assembly protein TadG
MTMTRFRSRVRSDQRGVAAIEFAIVAPVLVVLLLSVVTYFTAARDDHQAKRAAFTVSDLITRQTSVDTAFLALARQILIHTSPTSASEPALRVTSVSRPVDAMTVDWSYATPPFAAMTSVAVPAARLPAIAVGESLIVVETDAAYAPAFPIAGLVLPRLQNLTSARPRLVGRIARTN